MMSLLSFGSLCAACLSRKASFKFCMGDCVSVGIGKYEESQAIGQATEVPHLHRTCKRCGYGWLEECLWLQTDRELKQLL